MRKIKLSLVALALTAVTSTSAYAESRDLGGIFKECGIGAMLFSNDSTLAVISNVIWDLGTTATTSNVSSEGTCKGKAAKIATFVGHSYGKLETEIAAGEGKYVETLSKVSGKSVSDIRSSFAKVVADKDFANMSKEDKAQKLFNIVAL